MTQTEKDHYFLRALEEEAIAHVQHDEALAAAAQDGSDQNDRYVSCLHATSHKFGVHFSLCQIMQ